jgi:4-amino-4-deoxy-L-arabinose transferase-like glycosyltransferase
MITNHDPRAIDRIAAGVLVLLTIVAALTFRDYGLGWDDYTHSQYGELLLSFYTSGFKDQRAFSFVNLYYYGGGFDVAALLLSKLMPFGLFETRRLLGAIVGLIGLVLTWRLARRIGGPFAGLIALTLLATCPLYVGHVFINAKDAPFAVAMVVFLLGLVRAFEEYPRPSPATILILGLGFGLSIGSRIMSGFGVLTALAAAALLFAIEARAIGAGEAAKRLGRFWFTLIPAAILAYVVMGLVWPWAVIDPTNPIKAIAYFGHFFEKPWQELFEGVPIEPPDMPRRYVLVLLGLKLPEILLLLGIGGVAGLLVGALRPGDARRRAVWACVALAALLPIAVTVITRPAMYNGVRHFVFVLPPLAIAGGLASAWIERRALQLGKTAAALCAAIFLIGIGSPIIEMMRLHPYEYVHFNRIAGGIKGAQGRFMLDYWGLAFKQAAWAMLAKLGEQGAKPPAGRKWKVAVCGPHPPAKFALGDDFEPTWDPKGADFALMLGEFYCAKLNAPLLAEIDREGIVFARAYDIRGKNIEVLFTRPPVAAN